MLPLCKIYPTCYQYVRYIRHSTKRYVSSTRTVFPKLSDITFGGNIGPFGLLCFRQICPVCEVCQTCELGGIVRRGRSCHGRSRTLRNFGQSEANFHMWRDLFWPGPSWQHVVQFVCFCSICKICRIVADFVGHNFCEICVLAKPATLIKFAESNNFCNI